MNDAHALGPFAEHFNRMKHRTTQSALVAPVFLGHRWIESCITEYRKNNGKGISVEGKRVEFPESHYAAALMHVYVGTFSIGEIADLVSASPSVLNALRGQIDFMTLVDRLKIAFARHFREDLTLNAYSAAHYASIAAEYAAFEELVRNQIRVPLSGRLKTLAKSISDKVQYDLPIDSYDLHIFKKLFSFFVFEQRYLPGLVQSSLPQLERVAREIVWSRLGTDYESLDPSLTGKYEKLTMKEELRARYRSLRIH